MTRVEREYIEAILGAFEDGDADDVSAVFAEDAVFVDPWYPGEEYHGPAGVRRAIEGGPRNVIERSEFVVRNFWSAETSCVVEVETYYRTADDSERAFPQVFVVEMDNGRVARWQAYPSCSPHGGTG
jgi:ketosteroid isomerase-like protein